jgi:hypothetical protein
MHVLIKPENHFRYASVANFAVNVNLKFNYLFLSFQTPTIPTAVTLK